MELSDKFLWTDHDWDPCYLSQIVDLDFDDFSDHWHSNVVDSELVSEVNKVERYVPITEDISLDDNVLCEAVDRVEEE